jgi:hypothetical protein
VLLLGDEPRPAPRRKHPQQARPPFHARQEQKLDQARRFREAHCLPQPVIHHGVHKRPAQRPQRPRQEPAQEHLAGSPGQAMIAFRFLSLIIAAGLLWPVWVTRLRIG